MTQGILSCLLWPFRLNDHASAVDLWTLRAVQLQDLLNRGVVTTEEIVQRYLSQIEKQNHQGLELNADISSPPRAAVLEKAKLLNAERASGKLRGPFHGIPLIVKVGRCQHGFFIFISYFLSFIK